MSTDLHLRAARPGDCDAMSAIYNHYVINDTCTYQEESETVAERQLWLSKHDEAHPVLVAESGGQVIGWAALSAFRERSGYRYTVEDSLYLHHAWRGRGIGSLLLCDLMSRARQFGYHTIIAGISAEQEPSIALHRKYGFVEVARLREVGYKFGRWLDVLFLQLSLTSFEPRRPGDGARP